MIVSGDVNALAIALLVRLVAIYQLAVGKGAPPYSFLTILTHEQDESKIFLARFDQRLAVESDSE